MTRTAGTVALIITAVILIIWSSYVRDAHFFSAALIPVGDIDVSIGSHSYQIREGIVWSGTHMISGAAARAPLMLGYEKTTAIRSPLVALAGLDPAKLLSAVDLLNGTAALLAQRQSTAKNADLVANDLYPITFLKSVARLEEARVAFIKSGNENDAHGYEIAQDDVFRAYDTDLARFRSAFLATVPATVGTYGTLNALIGRDDILNGLVTLQSGMHATEAKYALRRACLTGQLFDCDASDITPPLLSVPASAPISPAAQTLVRETRPLSEQVGLDLAPLSDPLYQISESSCITAGPSQALLYTFRTMPRSGTVSSYDSPFLIGDIRFISSDLYSKLPFYEYFAQHGIRYVVSGALTYYACPETAHDQGTVVAMRDIRAFALQSHLSARAHGPAAQILAQLETTFGGASVVTEADEARYITTIETLPAGTLNTDEMTHVYTLALSLSNASAGIYQTVLDISSFEQNNMRMTSLGMDIDFSALYLFFVRSAFPSLYLGSNPSATGLHGTLFPPNGLTSEQLPYLYYSDLVKTPGMKKELTRDLTLYQQVHVSP